MSDKEEKVLYPYGNDEWIKEVDCSNCGNKINEYEDYDYHYGHGWTTTTRIWECKCGNKEIIKFEH